LSGRLGGLVSWVWVVFPGSPSNSDLRCSMLGFSVGGMKRGKLRESDFSSLFSAAQLDR
jgi:hypothetical protein